MSKGESGILPAVFAAADVVQANNVIPAPWGLATIHDRDRFAKTTFAQHSTSIKHSSLKGASLFELPTSPFELTSRLFIEDHGC